MSRIALLALAAALAAAPSRLAAQEGPFRLDGFVVTASPTPRSAGDVARSVTVLDGAELRALGITLVSEALRSVPGLTVVRGGSFGATTSVFMRGGESDYVQVLVDGVQVNSPGGAFDFAGLTLDNVERVEVVRGPASSLYGSDAMAGVIHVITRTGRGPVRGEASFRAGSFGRREASVGASGGGGPVGWSLGLTRLRTDGTLPVNNGFTNTVLSGSVRLAPDDDTRASLSLRLAERAYHFPTDGAGAVTDANAFTFGDEASVAVVASRRLAGGLELRGSLGVARTDGGTDDQPDEAGDTLGYFGFTSLDHVERATADLRANLHRGPVVATLGLEVEDQEQRSFSESLSQWGPSAGRSEYRRGNRAAYAHLTGEAGAAAFAVGGRLEDNERFGSVASWNVEAGWAVTSSVRVRGAAGVGVKEPTFFENYAEGWVRGNPDLAPERARSVEVGLEARSDGGRLVLRASAFSQRFRDLIQYVAAPASAGDPNFVNVAEAAARGVEVGGEARLGRVRMGADWSWLDTEVLAGGADDGPEADFARGWRLLRRPTHDLRVHAAGAVAGAAWTADVHVVGERDDRDFSSWPARRVALPRYATVGVGLELPVTGRIRVGARADNLLDARYEEVMGFPAPGRGFSLGGRVTFGGA